MLSLSVLSKHLSNSNGLGSEELESVAMLACFRGYFYPAPAGFPGGSRQNNSVSIPILDLIMTC